LFLGVIVNIINGIKMNVGNLIPKTNTKF